MEHHQAAVNAKPSTSTSTSTSSPPLDTFTTIAIWATCLMPAAMFTLSHYPIYTVRDPSDMKPPITIVPFMAAFIYPLTALGTYKLLRPNWGLPVLARPVKLVAMAPLVLLTIINFVTVLYGNLNTLAFTNSVVVDIVAPPEYLNEGVIAQLLNKYASEFELSQNVTQWKDSIDTAAFEYSEAMECGGPRTFVRIMTHQVIAGGAALDQLLGEGPVFIGAWVMVTGKKGTQWANKPRLFTVIVGGNDALFNNLLRLIWIDLVNQYYPFSNDVFKARNITFINPSVSTGNRLTSLIWTHEESVPNRRFRMNQYSCMTESNYISMLFNKRLCFYKKMDAEELISISGTVMDPVLSQPISFPTGTLDDCSKPYVRGYHLEELMWQRENFYCD